MLEAIALTGALLLALDRQIPGATRERALVAYYRLKGGAQVRFAFPPARPVQQLCAHPAKSMALAFCGIIGDSRKSGAAHLSSELTRGVDALSCSLSCNRAVYLASSSQKQKIYQHQDLSKISLMEVPPSDFKLLQAVGASVNQIITLTSSTGFHSSARKPPAGAPTALLGSQSLCHRIVHAPTASI